MYVHNYILCVLPPCSLLYRGEGQVKYCRATLSVLSFHSFLSAAPSLYLSSSPIFSYPSSRTPPISPVAFPFSCVLDLFPPQLSLLVCLHSSLPSGLPMSSCFSQIFLLGCIASQPFSSGRSSFFLSTLFVLVIRRTQLFSQTYSFCCCCCCSATPLSPDQTGMPV